MMKKLFLTILAAIAFFLSKPSDALETQTYIPDSPKKALIVIHGYGGSGSSVAWLADKLKASLPDTAFYFPTAPDKSPRGGYQWFVIPAMGEDMSRIELYKVMMADALRNVAELHDLIDEISQTQNIPYQNIAVSGFSQGGLMALLTALTNPNPVKKAVSLSGVPLVLTDTFQPNLVINKPDILLIQGDNDNIIPKDSLDLTISTLKSLNISYQRRTIPGLRHTINHEVLDYMKDFLQ